MNHSQRNLKKLIRAKEDSIADEELFLSAAYQKYQTSLARAVTGRYRYGLQVLLDWDISEQAGVAYTDNYKVHLNAANPITQSFPTRFLRSQSLTGLTGHEVGHLLYSDFTAHAEESGKRFLLSEGAGAIPSSLSDSTGGDQRSVRRKGQSRMPDTGTMRRNFSKHSGRHPY